jgi:outer membrane protein OmpA-like peptidoglycan-associated protein
MQKCTILIAGLLTLMLLGGCAQQPSRDAGQKVTVVILPKPPDGSIGAVVVRPTGGGKPVLLNRAYGSATVGSTGKVQTSSLDRKRVDREYSSALTALPAQPAYFLVYFVEGTDELRPEAKRAIDGVFTEFSARPSPEISVVGHTDFLGTDQFNDQLSLQRALRVRDLLVQRGIPAKSIEVSGRGKREPLYPTSKGVAEPRNRRVEVSVR